MKGKKGVIKSTDKRSLPHNILKKGIVERKGGA